MGGLRDHLARFRDSFLSSDHSHMPVNDMWVSFKSEVLEAIERFIPTKMTKTKYSLPWSFTLIMNTKGYLRKNVTSGVKVIIKCCCFYLVN